MSLLQEQPTMKLGFATHWYFGYSIPKYS